MSELKKAPTLESTLFTSRPLELSEQNFSLHEHWLAAVQIVYIIGTMAQQPADKGVSSADEAALAEHGDTNSAEKVQCKADNQFAIVSFQDCMLVQLIAVHQSLQKQLRSVNIAVQQLLLLTFSSIKAQTVQLCMLVTCAHASCTERLRLANRSSKS